jgi:hypothetical protein
MNENLKKFFQNTTKLKSCQSGNIKSKKEFAETVAEYVYTFPLRINKKIPIYNVDEKFININKNIFDKIYFVDTGDFFEQIYKKIKICMVFKKL